MNFIMALHLLTAISDMKSNGECAFYISRKRNLIRLFTKNREHMCPGIVCPKTLFMQ